MENQEHPAWELGISVCLLLLGLAVFLMAGRFPRLDDGQPGPALFPQVLSAGFVLGGLALALSGLKDLRAYHAQPNKVDFLHSHAGFIKVLVTLVIAACIPLLMPLITLVGGAGLAAALFTVLIGGKPGGAVGVGLFTALMVWGLFHRLLGVPIQ